MNKTTTIIGTQPLVDPKFIQTELITYERNGIQRTWEAIKGCDTVHILVNNIETSELLLVKQARVPVLNKHPEVTEIFEACAGLIDKYPDLVDTPLTRASMVAAEEVYEEIGYTVHPEDLEALPTYLSNVGMSGSTCYPFYCEVTSSDYVEQHLEDSEDIEVFALKYEDIPHFLEVTANTDATTRNLLQWFLLNKVK